MAEAFESGTGEYSLLLEAQAHTTDQRNRLERIEITEGNTPTTTDTHVYDHAGQLVADAEYWYQYDAFGRLASVHGRGDLTFLSSGTISGGTPGAWRLYLAYDGLGRLIREQKPWDGGSDHRQAWFYYDGVRRIVEVFKDPIVGAAMPLGAAPGGGYTTYTEREYVWGPDYVDECLWQVTRPGGVLHTLQDASKDVVALLDEAGAVVRQYTYDPYGQVQFEDVFGTPAHNRLGHHGLFFDRLDVDAPAVELAVGARGVYHNRNRSYDAGAGRFITADPNATGIPLVVAAEQAGYAVPVDLDLNLLLHYGDGLSVYAYSKSNPIQFADPYGLDVSSALISLDIMKSAVWSLLAKNMQQSGSPSNAGIIVGAFATVGQTAGAIYTAWAFGDEVDFNKNTKLGEYVKNKWTEYGVAAGGSALGSYLGRKMAFGIGAWVAGAAGQAAATASRDAWILKPGGDIWKDVAIGLGQAGLGAATGAATFHVAGIAMAAGFYGGIIEYAADTAFDW